MSKEKIHYNLYNCCSLNKFDKAQQILTNYHNDIDITYEDGAFFDFAIAKNNLNMLKKLLECADNKNLDEGQLKSILQKASDGWDLSPEMKEILSPYMDFEGSEHDTLNDSFLDDYQVTIENLNKTNSNAGNPNILNEDILRRFNAETEKISQKQIIEDVLGFNSHDITENHEDSNVELQLALVGKLNETDAH